MIKPAQDDFDLGKNAGLPNPAAFFAPAFGRQLAENSARLGQIPQRLRFVLRVLTGECRCFAHGKTLGRIN
jgi:hypothetical protein